MNQEDVTLNTNLVGLLKERRQITGTAYSKDTFGRTGHPSQHTCKHTESQSDGNDWRKPGGLDKGKVAVEAYEQALGKVDVFFWDDDT